MKGYLTCGLCGISISWEHLEHNFTQVKEFHDKECGQPRPMTINYAELIKGETDATKRTPDTLPNAQNNFESITHHETIKVKNRESK